MFQLQTAFIVINSANSGDIDFGDGSVYGLLSQRLVTVQPGPANTVLHNLKLLFILNCF